MALTFLVVHSLPQSMVSGFAFLGSVAGIDFRKIDCFCGEGGVRAFLLAFCFKGGVTVAPRDGFEVFWALLSFFG